MSDEELLAAWNDGDEAAGERALAALAAEVELAAECLRHVGRVLEEVTVFGGRSLRSEPRSGAENAESNHRRG